MTQKLDINYGIVAVNTKNQVIHFCGYEKEPTEADWEALVEELRTDPEFGLTEIPFRLLPATSDQTKRFRQIYNKIL